MFNKIKKLFRNPKTKPQTGVMIGAIPGVVVIIHNNTSLYLTPELAHKLADALPRFAQLAKSMK